MSNAGSAGVPFPVRYADIIFVKDVLDPGGRNPKQRRVVVLTPDTALAAGFPVVAAPVTSRLPPVLTADHVLLPFKNPPGTRHPATGLTRRAGVVRTWLVVVDPKDILPGRSGYVPPVNMSVVHAKTAAGARALGGWP
jgi:mRNA-degrading endonuclease toxin of MazEF toxin-antitoxin module